MEIEDEFKEDTGAKEEGIPYTPQEFSDAQEEVVKDMKQEHDELERKVKESDQKKSQLDGTGTGDPLQDMEEQIRKSQNDMMSEFYQQITAKKKEIENKLYSGWQGTLRKLLTKPEPVSDKYALEEVIKEYIYESEKKTAWHKKDAKDQDLAYQTLEQERGAKHERFTEDILLLETLEKKILVYQDQLTHNISALNEHMMLTTKEGYTGEVDAFIDSEKKAIAEYKVLIRSTQRSIEIMEDNLIDYDDSIKLLESQAENMKADRNDAKEAYRQAKSLTKYLNSILNNEQDKESMVARYRIMADSDNHFRIVKKMIEKSNKLKEGHFGTKNQNGDRPVYRPETLRVVNEYNRRTEENNKKRLESIKASKYSFM